MAAIAKQLAVVRLGFIVALATVAFFTATSARADRLQPLEQRINIGVGLFLLDTNTRIRADASNSDRGTEVDLEDTFGFDDQDRFRIDGYWRFADRHKVRFLYFSSNAATTRTLHETIEFNGTTFPIDASVRAEFETEIIELAYEYAFMRRDTFELAGSIGLHNLRVTSRLTANASSNLGAGGIDVSESAEADGPLPVIGIRGTWAFTDHLYLDAQAQFFTLEFDEYDGSLQDYKVSFVWQPTKYVGVGVGYNDFVTRLRVDGSRFTGRLRFGYGGPLAFITMGF